MPFDTNWLIDLFVFFLVFLLQTMASIKEQLLSDFNDTVVSTANKVTVVGVGQVGMACAFSILTQVCEQIFLGILRGCLLISENLFKYFLRTYQVNWR